MKKLLCVCVMMIFVLSSMSVFATDSAEGMIMQDKENEAIIKYNELLDEWTSGVDTEGNGKRQKAGTLKSKQSSDRIQKSNTEESNEKTEKSRRLVQNL